MRTAAAETVGAPPEAVYAFLERLENHWRLTSGFVTVDRLAPDGGRIVLRGPLGVRKRARTELRRCEPPAGDRPGVVAGTATDDAGTTARVEWRIAAAPEGSRVELATTIDDARGLDRVWLALGAGWWIRRGLGRSLRELEQALEAQRR
jgi:carbon monoxide dehydrogenase subunit G